MANKSQLNHQQLFLQNLSDSEQEKLIAGRNFDLLSKADIFWQKTDIETTANSELNLGENESNLQNSKYKLSQITLGASFTFGLPKNPAPEYQWLRFLPEFISRFWK